MSKWTKEPKRGWYWAKDTSDIHNMSQMVYIIKPADAPCKHCKREGHRGEYAAFRFSKLPFIDWKLTKERYSHGQYSFFPIKRPPHPNAKETND